MCSRTLAHCSARLAPRRAAPRRFVASTASSLLRRCLLGACAVIESFDDMGLKEDLLRGIYSYGFEVRSDK